MAATRSLLLLLACWLRGAMSLRKAAPKVVADGARASFSTISVTQVIPESLSATHGGGRVQQQQQPLALLSVAAVKEVLAETAGRMRQAASQGRGWPLLVGGVAYAIALVACFSFVRDKTASEVDDVSPGADATSSAGVSVASRVSFKLPAEEASIITDSMATQLLDSMATERFTMDAPTMSTGLATQFKGANVTINFHAPKLPPGVGSIPVSSASISPVLASNSLVEGTQSQSMVARSSRASSAMTYDALPVEESSWL